MRWTDLRPRMFIILDLHDHVEYEGQDEPGKTSWETDTDYAGHPTEYVVIRGQVREVNSGHVTVEGSWEDSGDLCFGLFSLVRGAVKRIRVLSPGTSIWRV